MVYVWLNRTYLMYNNILYVSKIVLATVWYVKSVYSDVPLHSIYIDILQFFLLNTIIRRFSNQINVRYTFSSSQDKNHLCKLISLWNNTSIMIYVTACTSWYQNDTAHLEKQKSEISIS